MFCHENQEGKRNEAFSKKKSRQVDLKVAKKNGTCFKCGKLGNFAKDCSVEEKKNKVIELNTLELGKPISTEFS